MSVRVELHLSAKGSTDPRPRLHQKGKVFAAPGDSKSGNKRNGLNSKVPMTMQAVQPFIHPITLVNDTKEPVLNCLDQEVRSHPSMLGEIAKLMRQHTAELRQCEPYG